MRVCVKQEHCVLLTRTNQLGSDLSEWEVWWTPSLTSSHRSQTSTPSLPQDSLSCLTPCNSYNHMPHIHFLVINIRAEDSAVGPKVSVSQNLTHRSALEVCRPAAFSSTLRFQIHPCALQGEPTRQLSTMSTDCILFLLCR